MIKSRKKAVRQFSVFARLLLVRLMGEASVFALSFVDDRAILTAACHSEEVDAAEATLPTIKITNRALVWCNVC